MTASNIISTMGVLLFTITLIWGVAWLIMRFKLVPGQKNRNSKNSSSELAIVETLALDTKRRLVKVEDGSIEHLFLLGPTTETHVDSRKISVNSAEKKKTQSTTEKKDENRDEKRDLSTKKKKNNK